MATLTIQDLIETGKYHSIVVTQIGFNNQAGILNKEFKLSLISDGDYKKDLDFKTLQDVSEFLKEFDSPEFVLRNYKY